MMIKEVMTAHAETIRSNDTVLLAAKKMDELNVGVLPVFDNETLSGIITDRDIVTRAVALQLNPSHASVGEIMTKDVRTCRETDTIEQAAEIMEKAQIRRLLVTNDSGMITGILTLGDIAAHVSPQLSGTILHDVSEPAEPAR